ncbi:MULTISPECIES: phosphotransferase [unclassified Streptomyces]|uniref:phosphotransferase n=1 Tax=unclassified Streptomyces TaxID=2593676 RepID=UPI001927D8BF|nr:MULTISPECIES: phosphotransferase [unclassified Streptomyces]
MWWTGLRIALDDIATVPTDRYTTKQQYLDWAMPKFLGTSLDTRVPTWTTAHGDLHWANLCAPDLQILDWEGWGLAPTGYDVAILHSYSLLVLPTAARIRAEFAYLLDTPAGRFAELVAITELLHSTTRGANLPLAGLLHLRGEQLLRDAEKTPRTLYGARGRVHHR